MKRRHLFDNGYPVANATLVAGSHVLVAVSRGALRKSSFKLASSFLRLADSSKRMSNTVARGDCSHAELRQSRDNHVYVGSDRQPSEKAARDESRDRPARPQPHPR